MAALGVATAFLGGAAGAAERAAAIAKGAPNSVFNQLTHASGYGMEKARVDAQVTLRIPDGKAGEVYRYLRETYVEKGDFVRRNFPGVGLKSQQRVDVSEFTDEYFDTPELDFYRIQGGIRYRRRVSTTDPNDRKNGRELVQIKATPPGHFELRTEIKFKVDKFARHQDLRLPAPVIVHHKQRDDFKAAIAKLGYDPLALRHVLTNRQIRSRVYLDLDGHGFLSFSVDEYRARCLWATATASSIDVGLQEGDFTVADERERARMWRMRQIILDDLQRRFPYLVEAKDDKYVILLRQLIAQLPFLPWLARHDALWRL